MPTVNTGLFLKKTLKDPLFHFLILGGILFVLSSLWGATDSGDKEIIITPSGQKHLANLFEITWQRPPTKIELNNLIEEYIREEIYYREALTLKLDENDTIVRRRMRQKLEFMQEDLSALTPPTEDDLKLYFENNRDNYKTDHIMSFRQILVSSNILKQDSPEYLSVLEKVNAGQDPATLSRSSLLPISIKQERQASISNIFGYDFFQQISKLDKGKWLGPVISSFGTHMVYVSRDMPAKPMSLDQARAKVSVDFMRSKREKASEDYYQNLRRKYKITVGTTP